MKLYQHHATQKLPITLDQAWEFLTDANNLKLLTPPELQMKVLYGTDRGMYPGQLIEYSVKPLPFYRTNWVTHITQVEHKKFLLMNKCMVHMLPGTMYISLKKYQVVL